MLANLRDLGRLAGWPLGRLAAALLVAVVLALLCHHCTPQPIVDDFPIVERSIRGLALATLPPVVALVAPSARVRRRAMQAKHREPQRTIRPLQCWACWPLSRWISLRYASNRLPERVRAYSTRERCESAEVARPHLCSASHLWAGCRQIRCHKPGMQATARAHRRSARRYRGAERGPACVQDARRYCHRSALTLVRRYRSSGFGVQFSDGREARSRGDFDDHVPPELVTMRGLSVSSSRNNTLKLRLEYCDHRED